MPPTLGNHPPLVNPRKWTTKVNIAIVIGVVVFLLIGTVWSCALLRPPENAPGPADNSAR